MVAIVKIALSNDTTIEMLKRFKQFLSQHLFFESETLKDRQRRANENYKTQNTMFNPINSLKLDDDDDELDQQQQKKRRTHISSSQNTKMKF